MTEYEMDNDVCPSSLDEDGKPMTEGETAHKWSYFKNFAGARVRECDECGAVDDEFDPALDDITYHALRRIVAHMRRLTIADYNGSHGVDLDIIEEWLAGNEPI